MPQKGLVQGMQEIHPLLVQGGKITAQSTEHLQAHLGAQAARDFLLHFEHAQVALSLIVIKRHSEIGGKGEHLPLAHLQPMRACCGQDAVCASVCPRAWVAQD